jgi:hypothetical protein
MLNFSFPPFRGLGGKRIEPSLNEQDGPYSPPGYFWYEAQVDLSLLPVTENSPFPENPRDEAER